MSETIKSSIGDLVAVNVDGQPMISAELVAGMVHHYERTLERLANAIKREGFLVIHNVTDDDFICQRSQ